MQVALVSRELFPFGGGGIAEYVWSAAKLLSGVADVTVITSDQHESEFRRLSDRGDPRILEGVRLAFVAEPGEEGIGTYMSPAHLYSVRAFEKLVELFPDGGPDLVEFSDYGGEGFVAVQARHTRDPRLRRTRVCIRLHTTAEICHVLDGHGRRDPETRVLCEMERYTLTCADRIIYPGGDVLGAYERFYEDLVLAPAVVVPNPMNHAVAPVDEALGEMGGPAEGPLRLLYLGRFERRKGVGNLIRAAMSIDSDEWSLTLLGGDTRTAPLAGSMKNQMRLTASGDPRITFADAVDRSELPRVIAEHDVVVLPSLWECWPYVALEALRLNRPVLATPTGGFVEIIEPGTCGWLTADASDQALHEALRDLIHDVKGVRALIESGAPRDRLRTLASDEQILEGYRDLIADVQGERPRATPAAKPPLVSAVVPYYRLDGYVEQAVRALLEQTYPALEIVIVNDGSFRAEDMVLAEISSRWPVTVLHQANSGLGAARDFGIAQTRGRYVLPMDADNELEPEFVERCVEALEADEDLAYVTSWTRFIDEEGVPYEGMDSGYYPFGNWSDLNGDENVAGDATAVIPRRVFHQGFAYSRDLTSYEDWAFYRSLARAGRFGHVIPEPLVRYRIRSQSMIREIGLPHNDLLLSEMEAHVEEERMQWPYKRG